MFGDKSCCVCNQKSDLTRSKPKFDFTYESNDYDGIAVLEGDYLPLEISKYEDLLNFSSSRSATEYWNLKKSWVEERITLSVLKSKLTQCKGANKKLHLDLADCNQVRHLKVKELSAMSISRDVLEQKCVELVKKNKDLEDILRYNRRMMSKQERRISALQQEKTLLDEKLELEREEFRNEVQHLRSKGTQQLKTKNEEMDKLLQDLLILKTSNQSKDSTLIQLESKIEVLEKDLVQQSDYHKQYISTIQKDLEESYEHLHHKFESVWTERDELKASLLRKDALLQSLQCHVLSEGYQLPLDTQTT